MFSIEYDLSQTPDLSNANPSDGTIVRHHSRATKLICLGDDDVLRVDGSPLVLYRHYQQSDGNQYLTLDMVTAEVMERNIVCAGLAVFLHRNPHLIPRNWAHSMEMRHRQSGIIFWGTTVRSSTRGLEGRVKLALQDEQPVLSVIDGDRLLSMASAVLYV